jgi:asparagine synthase (glutamine-hydrolysing)
MPPEPSDDVFFARLRRNEEKIAAHPNVVLSGEGGDEVLTGQSWPYLVYLWEGRRWKDIVHDFGGYVSTHGSIPPLRAGILTTVRRFIKSEDPFRAYPPWLNEDFARKHNLRQRWLELKDSRRTSEHPLHPIAYELLHSGICALALELEDAGWQRVNLENRASMLDVRMLTFLLRLPPVPWCMKKELCRRAMKGVLPQRVLSRPKTPFPGDLLEACRGQRDWIARLPRTAPGPVEL